MRTFIENYLHFMKNCIRPHYEKLKSLKSGFIENSIFENNRDPWRPPPRLSIHPDKMSGPLLPQTAMGGWLALPGKGSLWCAIESRLKASPPQCPLFRSFPSCPGSLSYTKSWPAVTQPHTTYTQTNHIRLLV